MSNEEEKKLNEEVKEETNEPKKEKKFSKKKKIIIGVSITALVLLGVGGVVTYKYINNNVEKNTKNNKEYNTSKKVDLTKGLNVDENSVYSLADSNDIGLEVNINDSKVTITEKVAFKEKAASVTYSTYAQVDDSYETTGITGKVKQALIGGVGQDITGTKIVLLMEDGTVYYNDVFVKKTDASGNTYYALNRAETDKYNFTKLDKANKIIKLMDVNVNYKNGSGHASIIGTLSDGSFYDLGIFIEENNTVANSNNNTSSNENTSNNTTTEVDLTKGINTTSGTSYSIANGSSITSLKIKTDNNKVVVTETTEFSKNASSVTGSTYVEGDNDYEVVGLNGQVKQTLVGGFGQDITGVTLIFLMEDGSVYYSRVFEKKYDTTGTSYYVLNRSSDDKYHATKINNITGINKLMNVNVSVERSSGHASVIGVQKDGSFYDLGVLIEN